MSTVLTAPSSRMRAQPVPAPEVERITPEKADEYLKTMAKNRPESYRKVMEYAEAMDEGRWVYNSKTIVFDDEGHLIDGYHRLKACTVAKKPFVTLVARGIDDKRAFATIDVGKTRTHGDLFALEGYADSNGVSAAAALLWYWKKGLLTNLPGPRQLASTTLKRMVKGTEYYKRGSGSKTVPKMELLEFSEKYREELASAIKSVRVAKAEKIVQRSIAAACFILFAEKSPVEAVKFINDFGSGAGLSSTDPVHVLREKLLELKGKRHIAVNRYAIMLLMIKAWNSRRDGEKWRAVRVVDNEKFPQIK